MGGVGAAECRGKGDFTCVTLRRNDLKTDVYFIKREGFNKSTRLEGVQSARATPDDGRGEYIV